MTSTGPQAFILQWVLSYNASVLHPFEKRIRNGMLLLCGKRWLGSPGRGLAGGRYRAQSSITAGAGLLSAPFPAGVHQILCEQGPAAPSRYFPYGKHLLLPDFTRRVGSSASQPLLVYTRCPELGKTRAQPPFSSDLMTVVNTDSRLRWMSELSSNGTTPTKWVQETATKKGIDTKSFSLQFF